MYRRSYLLWPPVPVYFVVFLLFFPRIRLPLVVRVSDFVHVLHVVRVRALFVPVLAFFSFLFLF